MERWDRGYCHVYRFADGRPVAARVALTPVPGAVAGLGLGLVVNVLLRNQVCLGQLKPTSRHLSIPDGA